MTTAKAMYRLKTVFCGLLISTSALSAEQKPYCSINDFTTFWPTVVEVYLTETLSEHKAPPQIINGSQPNVYWNEAIRKSTRAAMEFSELLEDHPVLCLLKRLPLNSQTLMMFSTMIHEREALTKAFSTGQLSAGWLTVTAINYPHFTANLLGHMRALGEITHTLSINRTQLTYFQRLANALVKDQSASLEAQRVYSKAFCHLVLMINEGRGEADLDRYSDIISSLPETDYSDFLLLDQFSTATIDTFLRRIEFKYSIAQNQ
ncbi:hypothetical protein [Endozoicomonas arenosclerae]|uniref:hypothetical protein n=1 Tax=Endozoicomonas arenosclerae TaxID=1633495 RepID=UPI0007842F59|nr:hypothetical protein [Endozoicomonas arenosclerae]